MTSPISFNAKAQAKREQMAMRRLAKAAQPQKTRWWRNTPEDRLAILAAAVVALLTFLVLTWPKP